MITLFLWLVTCQDFTPDARYPSVTVADAAEFGLNWHTARQEWLAASRHISHHDEWIRTQYKFDVYMDWKEQAILARDALDLIDNVTWNPTHDREWKLSQLVKLRRLIGDEMYVARRLPRVPGHMFSD